jgi:hypothetical protein
MSARAAPRRGSTPNRRDRAPCGRPRQSGITRLAVVPGSGANLRCGAITAADDGLSSHSTRSMRPGIAAAPATLRMCAGSLRSGRSS